jgi:4-carboxymuconolactone decarboxylase
VKDAMARIPYANLDDLPEDAKAFLQKKRSPGGNIFRMFANAGKATEGYLSFGVELRENLAIDILLYEYIIVRVGNLCRSGYVVRAHEKFLRKEKVSEDKILALRMRPELADFSESELVALQFVDELVANVRVSDETFAKAQKHFNSEQLMHITLAAGQYMLTCRVAETFAVDLQPA